MYIFFQLNEEVESTYVYSHAAQIIFVLNNTNGAVKKDEKGMFFRVQVIWTVQQLNTNFHVL